jgi:uncharacterized protein YigA (DUF484 family)
MSTLKQQHVADTTLTEDGIADYLQANPDFFERHSALLNSLRLPRPGGPALSSWAAGAGAAPEEPEARAGSRTSTSPEQRRLAAHSRSGHADAGCPDQAGVVRFWKAARISFNADQSVLVVFEDPAGGACRRFLRVVDRDDPAIASFRTFLQSHAPRCGQVRDAQRDFLFGAGNIEIGSVALVPLGQKSELGFLVVGSRDSDHFHPGMSIDFLARLGELVSCALRTGSRLTPGRQEAPAMDPRHGRPPTLLST